MRTVRKALTLIIALVMLSSCAGIPEDVPPELYWPLPPQKPRIKFVDMLIGSYDVTGMEKLSIKGLLFGDVSETHFIKPLFAAVKGDTLYVTDVGVVHEYNFKKKRARLIGRGFFKIPTGIAVDKTGRIYVADAARQGVYMVTERANRAVPMLPPRYLTSPGGIAVDDERGRLLIADVKKHVVIVMELNGKILFIIGKRGVGPGEFNYPYDVAVGANGDIYVSDSGNFRVQVFGPEGNFKRAFGTVGTLAGQFARPKGIALDSDGNIYVVDAAFGNFQIFHPSGVLLLAVGATGREPGQFQLPIGIAMAPDDKFYLVDQINRRVQIFQYIKYPDEQ